MASWTTPVTHSTGDVLAVSDWNGIANNETFLYQAPYASYYGLNPTTLGSNVVTQVTLDTVDFSGYGFSLSASNAIIPITGTYLSAGGINIHQVSGTESYTAMLILQNGVQRLYVQMLSSATAQDSGPAGSKILKCTASDIVGLYGYENAATSLLTNPQPGTTFLNLFFIGSA